VISSSPSSSRYHEVQERSFKNPTIIFSKIFLLVLKLQGKERKSSACVGVGIVEVSLLKDSVECVGQR